MKSVVWLVIGIVAVVAILVAAATITQTELLQTRVERGIGSATRYVDPAP